MKKINFIFIFVILLLAGCNTTERFLKTADPTDKYVKAIEWYNKGAYYKAIPVFEELMGLYKGSKTTEEIYYHYCMAQYKQGNYILSAFHFKNYVKQHPYSTYTEECLFMYAESHNQQSPKVELEQTNTYKAIDAYQLFINSYPESDRIPYCNKRIDVLRNKLEQKALNAANLYFRTKNYRAAAFSYRNLLIDFPDIDGVEDIEFNIVQSFFQYAEQSIPSKQVERFEDVVDAAKHFLSRYPNSSYVDEVLTLQKQSHMNSIQSAYDHAMVTILTERNKQLEEAKTIYQIHIENLEEEKLKQDANRILEEIYFQKVRTFFQIAQNSPAEKQREYYTKTVESYFDFQDTFTNSKFAKEADRLFEASTKNLKKIG